MGAHVPTSEGNSGELVLFFHHRIQGSNISLCHKRSDLLSHLVGPTTKFIKGIGSFPVVCRCKMPSQPQSP